MARAFARLRGRTQSQASQSQADGKSDQGKSQASGASSRRDGHDKALEGLNRTAAQLLEMLFGILYVMLKTDDGKNKYAWVPELIQLIQLLYFPLYTYSWGALATGATTGFGTSLPSSLSWINWNAWPFKTFAVVFWISVAFCMVALVNAAIVGYQFGQHRIRFIWPLKILRRAVTVLLDLLYIPIIQVLAVMFNCNLAAGPHLSYPGDLLCWDGTFLLYFGFAIASMAVTSLLALSVGLLFFEPDPTKSGSVLQARPHSRVEFVYLVVTILLSIAKGLKVLKDLHLGVIYLLCGLALLWLMLNFYPYYNIRMNCYRTAGFAAFTWFAIFVIVENQNNAYAGATLTAAMLAGAPVVFGAAWWGTRARFFARFCTGRGEAEYQRALHVELATRFLQEDAGEEALDLAEQIYQSGIAQFPKSSAVYVCYAQFLFFYRENPQQGFDKIRTAAKLRPFMDMRFFVYRKMNERQQLMHAAEVGSRKLDVIGYIEYVKNMGGARKGHRQCLRAFQQFWAYILDPQTPLRSLERAITRIDRTEKEAQYYYRTLLEQHPHNPRILRLYGRFLEECHNDLAKAQEHYDLADEHEEAHTQDFAFFKDEDEEAAGAADAVGFEDAGPEGPAGDPDDEARLAAAAAASLAGRAAGAGVGAGFGFASLGPEARGSPKPRPDEEAGAGSPPNARSPAGSRDGEAKEEGGGESGSDGSDHHRAASRRNEASVSARRVPPAIAAWLDGASVSQGQPAALREEAMGIGLAGGAAGAGGSGRNRSTRMNAWLGGMRVQRGSIDMATMAVKEPMDRETMEALVGNMEAPDAAPDPSEGHAPGDSRRPSTQAGPGAGAGLSTRRTAGLTVPGEGGSLRPSTNLSPEAGAAVAAEPRRSRRQSVIADLAARFATFLRAPPALLPSVVAAEAACAGQPAGPDAGSRRASALVPGDAARRSSVVAGPAGEGPRRSSVMFPRDSAAPEARRSSVMFPRGEGDAPRRSSVENRRQSVAYGLGTAVESIATQRRRPSRRMSVAPPASAKGPAQTTVAVDAEGIIRAVDPSFALFFGCGFEEAVGAPLAEFLQTATVSLEDEEGEGGASVTIKSAPGMAPNTVMRPVRDAAFVPRVYPSGPVNLEGVLGDDATGTANVVALPRYGRAPYAGTLAVARPEPSPEAALLGTAFSVSLRRSAVDFRVVNAPRGLSGVGPSLSPSLGPALAPPSPHGPGPLSGSGKNRTTFPGRAGRGGADEGGAVGTPLAAPASLEGLGIAGMGPPPGPGAPAEAADGAGEEGAGTAKVATLGKKGKGKAGRKSSVQLQVTEGGEGEGGAPGPKKRLAGPKASFVSIASSGGGGGGGTKKLAGRLSSQGGGGEGKERRGLSFGPAEHRLVTDFKPPQRKASVGSAGGGSRRGSLLAAHKSSAAGSVGGGSRGVGRKSSLAGSQAGAESVGEGSQSAADSGKAAKRAARIQKLKRRVAEAQNSDNSGVIARLGRVALLVTCVVAGAALGMYFFITSLVDDYSAFMEVVALSAGRRRFVVNIMYFSRALQLMAEPAWAAALSFGEAEARQQILSDAAEMEKSHLTLGNSENAKGVTVEFYRLASGGSREVLVARDSVWNAGLLFIDAARGVAKASLASLTNPAALNEHQFFIASNGAAIFGALDEATVNDQKHAEGLLAQVKVCLVLVVVGVVGLLSVLLFVVLWATVRKVEVEKEKALELFYDIPKAALLRMSGKHGRRRQEMVDEDDEDEEDDELGDDDDEDLLEEANNGAGQGGQTTRQAFAVFDEPDEEEGLVAGRAGRRKGAKWKGRRRRGAGLDPVTRRYAIAFGLLSLLFVAWFAFGFYYADRCQNFGAERNFSGKRRSLVRLVVYYARELVAGAPAAARGLPAPAPPLLASRAAAAATAAACESYELAAAAASKYLSLFGIAHRGLLYGNETMGLPATAGRDAEQDALMFESECLQRSQGGRECSPAELERLNGLHRLIMRLENEAEMLLASAPDLLSPANSHFAYLQTYEAEPMQANLRRSVELYQAEARAILAGFGLGQRAFVAAVVIAVFVLYFSVFRGVQRHLGEQARTTVFLMLMARPAPRPRPAPPRRRTLTRPRVQIPPDVLQKVPSIRQYLLGDNNR
eukprot:tig00021537_g22286.t1